MLYSQLILVIRTPVRMEANVTLVSRALRSLAAVLMTGATRFAQHHVSNDRYATF